MMKYREIELTDWTRGGAGATATCYFHKGNKGIMLKVFDTGITGEGFAETEFALSRSVEAAGLRTPKAIEIVSVDGCPGIIYQRIIQKQSISRLCADSPGDIGKYAALFAKECRDLHSHTCRCSDFPSRKERAIKDVAEHNGYSRHTKKVITAAINRLGDVCTCLHGDLQPGNLLISGDTTYWIDLGFFAWGDPAFDIACLYFFCKHPVGLLWGTKLCHMTRRQMKCFWTAFAAEYSSDPEELARTARKNVIVYLAYTIGLEDYRGLTAAVFDAYMNLACLFV